VVGRGWTGIFPDILGQRVAHTFGLMIPGFPVPGIGLPGVDRGAAFGAVGAGPGDAYVGGDDVAALTALPQPDSAMATENKESQIGKP